MIRISCAEFVKDRMIIHELFGHGIIHIPNLPILYNCCNQALNFQYRTHELNSTSRIACRLSCQVLAIFFTKLKYNRNAWPK